MGKRITGILAAFMLAVLAGSGMVQAAAIGTPYVAEQAIGKAPNMKAYVTGSKMKKDAAVTGKIGDIELTQNGDITTFQKSGEKMNYIILMIRFQFILHKNIGVENFQVFYSNNIL